MAALRSDFPDPAKQAQVILEICGEDLSFARRLIWTQVKSVRNCEEIDYWRQVEKLLTKQASTCDLNTQADEEAER